MIYFILIAGLLAVVVESYLDRHGETKSGKLKDSFWLAVTALGVSLIACAVASVNPLKTIALILGVRVLVFDTLVNWFLKRNSESHKDINIWTYVGKTSFTDRNILSRIPWWIVLLARVLIFAAALVLYTSWR